jgi:hypothetical protein
MNDYDKIWKGKKVYIKLKSSNRAYSGIVLDETEETITLKDIVGHLVRLNKSEIGILQEEK